MSKLEELVAKMYAKDPISKGEVEQRKRIKQARIKCGHIWGT